MLHAYREHLIRTGYTPRRRAFDLATLLACLLWGLLVCFTDWVTSGPGWQQGLLVVSGCAGLVAGEWTLDYLLYRWQRRQPTDEER